MIEILLQTGVWVEVYTDGALSTEALSELADTHNLIVGTNLIASLPDMTTVDCAKIAAIRINK